MYLTALKDVPLYMIMEKYCASEFRKNMFRLLPKIQSGIKIIITHKDRNYTVSKDAPDEEIFLKYTRLVEEENKKYHCFDGMTRESIKESIARGRL
jgi:hypothetical protein